jgi:hypothetical protein
VVAGESATPQGFWGGGDLGEEKRRERRDEEEGFITLFPLCPFRGLQFSMFPNLEVPFHRFCLFQRFES